QIELTYHMYSMILIMSSLLLTITPHQTLSFSFFFNAPATTEIYTLSLHDALPICRYAAVASCAARSAAPSRTSSAPVPYGRNIRSEEHTSELQSPYDIVCRLLLEKKNAPRLLWNSGRVNVLPPWLAAS